MQVDHWPSCENSSWLVGCKNTPMKITLDCGRLATSAVVNFSGAKYNQRSCQICVNISLAGEFRRVQWCPYQLIYDSMTLAFLFWTNDMCPSGKQDAWYLYICKSHYHNFLLIPPTKRKMFYHCFSAILILGRFGGYYNTWNKMIYLQQNWQDVFQRSKAWGHSPTASKRTQGPRSEPLKVQRGILWGIQILPYSTFFWAFTTQIYSNDIRGRSGCTKFIKIQACHWESPSKRAHLTQHDLLWPNNPNMTSQLTDLVKLCALGTMQDHPQSCWLLGAPSPQWGFSLSRLKMVSFGPR